MASNLVAHRDTHIVTRAELFQIVPPESSRYWKPVAHVELVETLLTELVDSFGHTITQERYAINTSGLKLFGTIDLSTPLVPGSCLSIGFRHSNDKRIALQVVAGGRVFVCDNMMLSGDNTVLKQKHTWGFSLRNLVQRGLSIWQAKTAKFRSAVDRMQETTLTDESARAMLSKALYEGILTFQTFKLAYECYFVRGVQFPVDYSDCAPRTAYGLHNAITRALKQSTPNVQFESTVEIGKVFDI